MLNLKEFRSRAFAYPDLLPWGFMVENGIVMLKAGGYLAGWEFTGPDLDSATEYELTAMAARINKALMLGDGWVIHCDAIRETAPGYAPKGAFPDPTTALMDEMRREAWNGSSIGFRSRYVLTVSWFPEPDAVSKVAKLFYEDQKEDLAMRSLARFKERLTEIEGWLSGFLKINRMLDYPIGHPDRAEGFDIHNGWQSYASPLLGHLDQCALPGSSFRPLIFGECPLFLDSVLGNHDFATGFMLLYDNATAVMCLYLSEFPSHSHPGLLDFMSRMSVEYRWSTRFICLDYRKADKEIDSFRSKWASKRLSLMNHLRSSQGNSPTHMNLDAVGMTNDAIAAQAENASGDVLFGYYTSVLLLSHHDEVFLKDLAQEIAKYIRNQGVGIRIETANAVEAVLGTMPGNTASNVRRPLVSTLNLAHMLPFTAVWSGFDEHPCPFYPEHSPPLFYAKTDGKTPFRACLHSGDLGHTAIIGPTGSGKSTLLGLIAAQHFRYPNAQAFAFDKSYAMMPLAWAAGGEHYDIGGSDSDDLAFCPLAQIDEPVEQDWAAEWLENLCELQGVSMTPEYRQRIYQAVVNLAQSTTQPRERTLTNFVLTVQDKQLRNALEFYTLKGAGGKLLDAESDSLRDGRFQVFEIEHLMNKGEKLLLPTLLYLFHRLEQRLGGQPSLLILDEAWVMLAHPVFKARIIEWLVVMRKRNVAVVFATQSLSQLRDSGIADIVFESCPTKILLSNPAASTGNIRPLYEKMGLNEKQIQIIAQGGPKRDYYMVHADGKRQFELGLSRTELAFIGASGREDLSKIRVLRETHGDGWPAQWLIERGLPDSAEQWKHFCNEISP